MTSAPETFVALTYDWDAPSCASATLELPWWNDDVSPDAPWFPIGRGVHVVNDVRPKERVRALYSATDKLILRRSAVEKLLAPHVERGELALHPVRLEDAKGTERDDWVLAEVLHWFPADRDATDALYHRPGTGHAGLMKRVKRVAWGEGRAPRHAIVRLGEFPTMICASKALADALYDVTKGAIIAATPPYDGKKINKELEEIEMDGPLRFYREDPPPLVISASAAAAAGAAFWQLYAGGAAANARAGVCKHPHYAYWLARVVDRAASDDTRAAACKHPYYALLYARDVDKGPRDDTRSAASRHKWAAINYAGSVDRGPHPVTIKAGKGADYDAVLEVAKALFEGAPKAETAAPKRRQKQSNEPCNKPELRQAKAKGSKGNAKKGKITSRPLDASEQKEVEAATARTLSRLGCTKRTKPSEVVAAINREVTKARKSKQKDDLVQLAVDDGATWGTQFCIAYGWSWRWLRFEKNDYENFAIVSPKGEHAIFALVLVKEILATPSRSNSLELLFNMVGAGDLPPSKPGAHAMLE